MPTSDYERFRRQLETQLRADVELLYEAYRAKLRAYETVCRARGELEGRSWEPLELAPGFSSGLLLSGSQVAAPAGPRKRAPLFATIEAVEEALEKLDGTFDKNDLIRVLGFEPSRATLFRALEELQRDGVIALHSRGAGKSPSVYRKLPPSLAEAARAEGDPATSAA